MTKTDKDNSINFTKLFWIKVWSGGKLLLLPLFVAILVLLVTLLLSIGNQSYWEFLLSVGDYSSFYGVCANISITFIALLFAIASINIALQASNSEKTIRKLVSEGANGLKLLIKTDLIRVSICTIILQVSLLLVTYIIHIPNIIQFPMMAFTVAIMIYSLWFTINSVYYAIVQNNINPALQNNLLNLKDDDDSKVWYYPAAVYDVYTVKKTLYPAMYRLLTHQKGNQIEEKRGANDYNKHELITAWNKCFYKVLTDASSNISTTAKDNSTSYLETLKNQTDKGKGKQDKYSKKYFKLFRPKIQAPDQVVEICLDYEYQYQMGKLGNRGPNEEKELLESLLYLLHCCKLYVEDRQDERKIKHLFINRCKYKNLNDTFMYTQYGNILYRLSLLERDQYHKEYCTEARKMYDLAVAIDCDNSVAQHNSKFIKCNNVE